MQRPVNIPKWERSTALTHRQRAPPQRFSLKNTSHLPFPDHYHFKNYTDVTVTECVLSFQKSASEWEEQEQHLLEMFPKCSLSEARSALSIAKGDMEEAVRLIIEGDVQLSPSPLNVSPYCSLTRCLINFVLLVWAVGFHDVFLCSGKPREEHFLSGRPETEGEHPWEVRLLWSHCEQKWLYFSNRHNFVSSAGTCWSTTRTITKRIAPLHQKMWVPLWPPPPAFLFIAAV